ncbi:MAG: ABC transporter permease [Bacteroidetes bacterium]|nr:ABC transporter permease [Bacteroidota bacterium]MBS1973901.1 ABC transporter permease [Bacteroidota bacterium]
MFRYFEIIGTSFRMAMQEFRSNKLRTFLSLLGITFGIFCIISVLSTISSMEYAIQNDIKSLGTSSVFIDKWEYRNDNNYPWWKFIKRPEPKYEEMKLLKQHVPVLKNVSYSANISDKLEYGDNVLKGVTYYGVTEDYAASQNVVIGEGRYFQQSEFDRAANSIVIGFTLAEKLFSKPEKALGKIVRLKNDKEAIVIGVIKKQGQSIADMWNFDNSIILPYNFMKQIVYYRSANPIIIAQGKPNVSMDELKDELTGAMRSIRKLSPTQEDNYALNDIESLSKDIHALFANVSIGGWAISVLSLIVGMFGVANIMFVTVRERTNQIGLKKAIGAKRGIIMMEFLLESAFLCIIGGLIGLLAVVALTQIFSAMFSFKVFIPVSTILMAISICLFVGVAAGIIPAFIAARMDPVVAIRSK